MKPIIIYTTPICPYCRRSKDLFRSLGVAYQEVDISVNPAIRDELVAKYNWQTVPMIFIGEEFIGGYDDLMRLQAEGTLLEKINI